MAREQPTIFLKPGRERAVSSGHPWIFSGAIARADTPGQGEVCRVADSRGNFLALAYYNRGNSLAARVISLVDIAPLDAVRENVKRAVRLRRAFTLSEQTDSCRLINGEGDLLPGLVVDVYAGHLIIQSGSRGIDLLLPDVVSELQSCFKPLSIYERSTLACRNEEKLQPAEGQRFGETPDEVQILENGIRFIVQPKSSQKTGFFLDQREMRALVRSLSSGRSVLNCFAFSGGFTLGAFAGGASRVDSVDVSSEAIELLNRNVALNGYSAKSGEAHCADAFDFLAACDQRWDLVILDPPAFAKRKEHIKRAASGYGEINRLAAKLVTPGGMLLTCSCSHHVDEELFQKIVSRAVNEAGRSAKILQRHRMAFDHPVLAAHPEGEYLKSLLVAIE